MSESEHTPGPWHVGDQIDGCDQINAHEWIGLASVVTRMDDADNDCEDGIANARLIAAAPDMYEALKEAVLQQGHGLVNLRQCRDAIAKAEGRE